MTWLLVRTCVSSRNSPEPLLPPPVGDCTRMVTTEGIVFARHGARIARRGAVVPAVGPAHDRDHGNHRDHHQYGGERDPRSAVPGPPSRASGLRHGAGCGCRVWDGRVRHGEPTSGAGGLLDLEPGEAVEHAQHRARDVEEAVRQVDQGRHAEHGAHERAARVPRHERRRDRAAVGGESRQVGRREAALGELGAEDPAGSTSAMYWSPATTLSPNAHAKTVRNSRPVLFAAANIGSISRLIRPNSSSSVPKVTAPMISQSVISMLSMPPRDSSRSMSAMPESIEKPFAMAFQIALIDSTTTAAAGDEVGVDVRLQERTEDSREERRRQQRERRRHLPDRQDRQQHERQQVSGVMLKNSLSESSSTVSRRSAPCPGPVTPEDHEDDEGDDERRHRRPHLALDVLVDVHLDHLRREDRRLRQRRQLVAEVRAGDDGAGGDRRRDAEQCGDADQADADRSRGRPRAADAQRDDAADQRGRGVVPSRRQHLDAVVDQRRDRPARFQTPISAPTASRMKIALVTDVRSRPAPASWMSTARWPFLTPSSTATMAGEQSATWIGPSSASSPKSSSAAGDQDDERDRAGRSRRGATALGSSVHLPRRSRARSPQKIVIEAGGERDDPDDRPTIETSRITSSPG